MTRQNVVQIPINQAEYEWKMGSIANHKTISEYSVMYHSPTEEREIRNDRTNVRYLIDDAVRDSLLPFDLKKGLATFQDKGEALQKEPCLQSLCNWAISQPGSTIKEVFDGADFATWRGTLKRIAATIHKKDAWKFIALSLGGVIFISEQARKYHGGNHHLPTYSGFKFEQYITTNKDGDLDSDEPVDNRSTFEIMVTSNLMLDDVSLKLCCGAEIDALRGDEPIELKTGKDVKNLSKFETVLQSEIVGIKALLMGIKGNDFMVERVEETSIKQIKAKSEQIALKTAQSYAFLADFLFKLKTFLGDHEACEAYFDSRRMEVVIKRLSIEEANRNGKGVTAEFMKHFSQ